MRVAFCLSGQLRTWKRCYTSWNLLFERFKEQMYINDNLQYATYADESFEIDYFIHTWDFNTPPHFKWDVNWQEPDPYKKEELLEPYKNTYIKIEKSEIGEVLNILQPKKALVENWNISSNCEQVMDELAAEQTFSKKQVKGHISWAGSQLYSIMRSAHLKRQHEIENKFEYDMCIRSRFDLEFNHNARMVFARDFEKPKPRTIYSVHNYSLNNYPFDAIGDIFYYSDSQTFDMLSTMYNHIPHIDQRAFKDSIKIEEVMTYCTRMFQLNNKSTDFSPDVIRD